MKIALPIVSIFLGFIGLLIDSNFSPEYPLFTFILFLLPLIWAVGVLYDELPSVITENKDDCKDTLTK